MIRSNRKEALQMRKVIISGGGTGGHIFPAIAIANEIRKRYPEADILFVGANGRMEMQKVPEAGYKIQGLNIAGLQRKLSLSNLLLPFKVIASLIAAYRLLGKFRPEVAIGVGGYASAPLLFAAQLRGIPTLIQEQNGFAGLANKILARFSRRICVAYEGMESYFPKEKIVMTGNPVREDMVNVDGKREEALRFFNLPAAQPTLLVFGGSLGARTINEAIQKALPQLQEKGINVVWQTGKSGYARFKELDSKTVRVLEFIQRMDLAYAAADLAVSRAGALSVSELCLTGLPVILVPSPNVAEDHQTHNAMRLVKRNAAVLVKDSEAGTTLPAEIVRLMQDGTQRKELGKNILALGQASASARIVDEVEKCIRK